MKQGRFITVEGVEGAGKSTNLSLIVELLQRAGIPVLQTREPGGTPFAESVRELLLAPREERVDSTAELLLMFAARAQHLNAKIRPALEQGTWVVCDRFTDATYAYQGGGRQLGFAAVAELERLVQGDFRPDRTFFLDLPVEQGLERIGERGDCDRFEREEIEFFERVRAAYHELMHADPGRFARIDASLDLAGVRAQIQTQVARLLEEAGR